ncbi:hypothetical protein F4777DRAFT_424273 [Nemania sp. FL0916]|nr:hypothetical protein F4777DRAFT_424273 [Nemania sp. FL0916]
MPSRRSRRSRHSGLTTLGRLSVPPNSFTSWMRGTNIKPPKKSDAEPEAEPEAEPDAEPDGEPNRLRRVVSFEAATDDESGVDQYTVTVPRGSRTQSGTKNPSSPPIVNPPLRSALKKRVHKVPEPELEPELMADSTSDYESSDESLDSTCPCTDCRAKRRKLRKITKANHLIAKRHTPVYPPAEESEDDDDSVAAIVHAHHLAKKLKKRVAFVDTDSTESLVNVRPRTKGRNKRRTTVVTMSSGSESDSDKSIVRITSRARKAKNKRVQTPKSSASGSSAEETTSGTDTDLEEDNKPRSAKSRRAARKKAKKEKGSNRRGRKSEESENDSSSATERTEAEPEADPTAKIKGSLPSGTPGIPQDPRPNAFYDNGTGTTRVYHGGVYGNPYGALYPNFGQYQQGPPSGVPYPTHNAWPSAPPYANMPYTSGPQDQPRVPPNGNNYESNPWFQGWGTVGPTGTMPPPPPDHQNRVGWNSNVAPAQFVNTEAQGSSDAKMKKKTKKFDDHSTEYNTIDELKEAIEDLRLRSKHRDKHARERKEPSSQPNNDWDARNANTGSNSAWDKAASNNNNNSWNDNNNAASNDDWDKNYWKNTGSNKNSWNDANQNNSRWGGSRNISANGSRNISANGSRNISANGSDKAKEGRSKSSGNPPRPVNTMPGSWGSPIRSHGDGGDDEYKVLGANNNWDQPLAQGTGSYWDTEEGKADLTEGNNPAKNGNSSW